MRLHLRCREARPWLRCCYTFRAPTTQTEIMMMPSPAASIRYSGQCSCSAANIELTAPSSPVSSLLGCHLIRGPGAGLTNLLPFALLSRGTGCSHHVLFQQVDRYGEQNHVLHQEGNVAGHRREAGSRVPAVRHDRNDGDRRDERADGEDGPEAARLGIPEPPDQQRRGQPLRNPQEPAGPPDAENWVHPESQRPVADEGDQRLGLVLPPL